MQNNQSLQKLKLKVEELNKKQQQARRKKNDALKQLDHLKLSNANITNEIQIQKKKYLALNVFVAELQRKYDTNFTDIKNFNTDHTVLQSQKMFLKQILVKKAEQVDHYKSTHDFLRIIIQKKGKLPTQIKLIQQQSELIAKLNKKLYQFQNQQLVCTRKWTNLQRQNIELQNRFKSLSIQIQRQNTVIQQYYEKYIDKINKYNTKLAYLNGVDDDRTISKHLIQQMSFLQQQRRDIQQQLLQLRNQLQMMKDDYENSNNQNYSIKQFFSDSNQHTKVANKMRIRIQQLNDLLKDYKVSVSSARILNLSKTIQYVANYEYKLKQANKHLTHRLEQSIKGNACIDQVLAGKFFSQLLEDKDNKLIYLRKGNSELLKRIQESEYEKQLIKQNNDRIREELELNNIQKEVNEQQIRKKILSQYTFKK